MSQKQLSNKNKVITTIIKSNIKSNINQDQSTNENKIQPEEITQVIYTYGKKYNNFTIICSIIAVILSIKCNHNSPIYLKLLYGIIAILLSYWYILFYLIYYIFLKKSCSDDITFDFNLNDLNLNNFNLWIKNFLSN
jgi:hypothetical protein